VLLVIVIIAAAAFAVYKYKPELFNGNQQTTKTGVEQPKEERSIKQDTIVADTTKTAPPILDTPSKAISKPAAALNTPVANADTVAKPQYVIFAGSFKTQSKSDLAVKNYKSIGIDARLLNGPGSGRLIKVIIGGFATYQEGETLRIKLVKSGKLRKDSYTQIINQKK
jgi:cell division septation protein DedD